MKTKKLVVVLATIALVTIAALLYLIVRTYQAGGPFSIDSEGCGVEYVSHPGGGDEPVRICRENNVLDSIFVPIAKIIVICGPIISCVIIVQSLRQVIMVKRRKA